MIFNIKSTIGRRGIITEDSFSFTGDYLFARDEETGDFELALLESGTLTWLANPGNVDLCLVGAGQNGGTGSVAGQYSGAIVKSGKGGDGGRVNTETVQLSGVCTAVVGTSGAESTLENGDSTYTSANGAAAKDGGRAATMYQQITSVGETNKGGSDGVFAYGAVSDETIIPELAGVLLGPSGGGGHANNVIEHAGAPSYYTYVYTDQKGGVNTGGQTGGGNGGTRDHYNGYAASGYGAGGGGGYANGADYSVGVGGAGSDGIILIRNHREA